MQNAIKGILVDRDGVLIENRPDYVKSISEVQFITDVYAAVKKLWDAGYIICVVTNQAGVSKGLYSYRTVHDIHRHISYTFHVNEINRLYWYVCPHRDEDNCECRKPKPGLLLQAMSEHCLEPANTWMVGDNRYDIAAGKAAGCKTALVQTGLGSKQVFNEGWQPDIIIPDFPTFVDNLLGNKIAVASLDYF